MIVEVHPGFSKTIDYQNSQYERMMVRTPHINAGDDFASVIARETRGFLQQGDILMVAESVVAIAQNRLRKFDEVEVSRAAQFFASLITPTSVGYGFSLPPTMQVVLEEVGLLRMSVATLVAALTKPFGINGMFYRVLGSKARAIDGPTKHAMPPADEYITLYPQRASDYARTIQKNCEANIEVVIVDANDVGVNIMGSTSGRVHKLAQALCRDNPMGQKREGTPVMIGRAR